MTSYIHIPDFMMVVPNQFMLNSTLSVDTIMRNGHSNNELYDYFIWELEEKEEVRLHKLYETTLQKIVYGKAYKLSCLLNTRYKYFKSWAKDQPRFARLPMEEFNRICSRVNQASAIYDKWDTIVKNLTDRRMMHIDARRLSIGQLEDAKDFSWCLRHNEGNRKKGKHDGDTPYPLDKYDQIFQDILRTGIMDDIDHDPSIAAIIGGSQSNSTFGCSIPWDA